MRRRSLKKSTAADLLISPLPTELTPNRSPISSPGNFQFDFSNAFFNATSASISKKNKCRVEKKSCANIIAASTSVLLQASISSPSTPALKSLSTISDLKEMASSRLDSLKRKLELSNSEIMKDMEASQSRIQKRFKIQVQACHQVMNEADREYKKMTDRINESREALKASFADFIAEAQTSAYRCMNL